MKKSSKEIKHPSTREYIGQTDNLDELDLIEIQKNSWNRFLGRPKRLKKRGILIRQDGCEVFSS